MCPCCLLSRFCSIDFRFMYLLRSEHWICSGVQAKLNLSGAGPVADVAISGLLGWVSFRTEQTGGRLALRIWAPVGIEAYVRPPLPVPSPPVRSAV